MGWEQNNPNPIFLDQNHLDTPSQPPEVAAHRCTRSLRETCLCSLWAVFLFVNSRGEQRSEIKGRDRKERGQRAKSGTQRQASKASRTLASLAFLALAPTRSPRDLLASPCSLLSALCSLLSALCSRLSALCSLLSVLGSWLSALYPLLSVLCFRLSALCPLPSALCSLTSTLCSLLSASSPIICSPIYVLTVLIYSSGILAFNSPNLLTPSLLHRYATFNDGPSWSMSYRSCQSPLTFSLAVNELQACLPVRPCPYQRQKKRRHVPTCDPNQ
jgi:hypothetical protein